MPTHVPMADCFRSVMYTKISMCSCPIVNTLLPQPDLSNSKFSNTMFIEKNCVVDTQFKPVISLLNYVFLHLFYIYNKIYYKCNIYIKYILYYIYIKSLLKVREYERIREYKPTVAHLKNSHN